jgi:hypothetical protein
VGQNRLGGVGEECAEIETEVVACDEGDARLVDELFISTDGLEKGKEI